jgi:hypothetical protein
MLKAGLSISTLLTLAARAPNAPSEMVADRGAGASECFRAQSVNGFTPIDRDTVQVRAGVNDVYELQLAGSCPRIDWSQRIGIRSTRGADFVCRGFDAELILPRGIDGRPDVCQVRSVRKLPPPADGG